jgi:biopolymer transport protein ExbD
MNPHATTTPRTSKHPALRVAIVLVTTLFALHTITAQQLQKGVSVQMATTSNATAVPAADDQNAWVVAVDADGSLYFGADPMTPEVLADWIKTHPRNREAKLYIKADARARFAYVKTVLGLARSSNFEDVVLLTSQPGSPAAGSIVPPKGIEVLLRAPASGGAIQVRLSGPARGSTLTVNDRRLPPPELESTLKGLVHNHAQIVQVEANDAVPFGDIMRVIDQARAAGATVALPIFHSI